MLISRLTPLRTAAALAGACVTLFLASSAHAAVFCVHDPACPPGGTPVETPAEALKAADADLLEDTVRLGPGNYSLVGLKSSKPVDIVGAGIGETSITDTDGGVAIDLANAASSVTGLTVIPTEPNSYGVVLSLGADATDVSVVAPDTAAGTSGFVVKSPGSVLQGIRVDVPDESGAAGVVAIDNVWIRDAEIIAGIGVTGPASLRRAVVRAFIGLRLIDGSMNASNVLITPHPRRKANSFSGIQVGNNIDAHPKIVASNLTIDGGGIGTAIEVASNSASDVTSGTASAIVTGAILRGVPKAIVRDGLTAPETASVDISYSSFDGTKVYSKGAGSLTQGPGNRTDNPDPRFVDPAHLDYRLRHDSPLVDAGRPTAFLGEEQPELAGVDRVRDSDGNGSAIRDIGAYEYQRRAPVVSFSATPATALVGSPFSFASTVSDPDGDPIVSRAWSFGDGTVATGATASHAYSAAGTSSVRLSATDASGLTSSATKAVTVLAAQRLIASLFGKKVQRLGKTVSVTVGCNVACTAAVRGSLRIRGTSKIRRLGKGARSLTAGGTVRIKLRLSKQARRAAKPALLKHKRVTATIKVAVSDPSGETVSKRRTVRLKLASAA